MHDIGFESIHFVVSSNTSKNYIHKIDLERKKTSKKLSSTETSKVGITVWLLPDVENLANRNRGPEIAHSQRETVSEISKRRINGRGPADFVEVRW